MNSLTSKILTSAGIVLIGGASLISGCTKILYDHPVDRFIMDNFVPEALQPPSIIEERRKAREKENKREVIYNTPPEHVVLTHDGMWRPEEGYTWVNPEPAKNKDYRVRKIEKPEFFACNEWKDLNGDSRSSDNEFFGIKNKFYDNEKLLLTLIDWSHPKGTPYNFKIISPNSKVIYLKNSTYSSNGFSHRLGNDSETTQLLIKKGGYGNYQAIWNINNGEIIGKVDFEILPTK
mgnify:CR=1 FL=1